MRPSQIAQLTKQEDGATTLLNLDNTGLGRGQRILSGITMSSDEANMPSLITGTRDSNTMPLTNYVPKINNQKKDIEITFNSGLVNFQRI